MGDLGRGMCPSCREPVLTVRVGVQLVNCDWPHSLTGDVAVMQTVAGGWQAEHAPVGETVRPPYKRFRRHLCGDAQQDLSEPVRSPDPAWRQGITDRNASKRNGRRKPRQAAITSYRVNPGGSK